MLKHHHPKYYVTRLPSNLRPTIREYAHVVTRNHFRSRDKDGGPTIRSAIAENPMMYANHCMHHSVAIFYRTGVMGDRSYTFRE